MQKVLLTCLLTAMLRCGSILKGQERLVFPDDEAADVAVDSASRWLIEHVINGKLNREGRQYAVSVITCKDPKLNPELPPGADATGEATAIFMLAKTVVGR